MFDHVGVFYRGLVLGLMIAAPVGPIGLLCIRRTLRKGLAAGFATGLGAACADTLFAAVAALGVTAILEFMKHYDACLRIVGGGLLLVGAWHTWHDRPKPPNLLDIAKKVAGLGDEDRLFGVVKALISGFAITITNPVTMFATLAVVATFGQLQSRMDALTIVAGVFAGSTLWWIMLSGGVAMVRDYCNENRVMMINRTTAVALAGLAVWAVASGVRSFLG